MAHVQIFLSTVSAEFRSYREALRGYLTRPNVSVKVQEEFIATGTLTLDKLDEYIRQCDAVVHIVGDMTGSLAQVSALEKILNDYPDLGQKLPPLASFLKPGAPMLSYTQWEAWLALYHDIPLIIAAPEADAKRDAEYERLPAQHAAQQAHLAQLNDAGHYSEISFTNVDQLAAKVLRSKLFDLFVAAGMARRVIHLPYSSLGELFKGRDEMLETLHTSLTHTTAAIVGKALHGLGGVGKTRLAVEYAWRHANDYTALLLIGADSPETLQRNLAGLCAPTLLDLPEHQVSEEAVQSAAALRWLQCNPSWLLILDNVDSEAAAQAVEVLLPQLSVGQVLITSRISNWSASVQAWPLDVLHENDAVAYLLVRTEKRRRKQAGDEAQARKLAQQLGGLALALEQAAAYIAQHRLSLAAYLVEWAQQRDKVLTWYDPRLMQYPNSVAVTWQTSFAQLSPPARQLLQHLAWLAPEPIPESLLEVAIPDTPTEHDAYTALAELESYSLITRAQDAPSFTVHRLVQEVTRRGVDAETSAATLSAALNWINAAFIGDPSDVRNWPVLDLLLPHVRMIVTCADEANIAKPTARLMNDAGLLLLSKALYAEAEQLMRRALAIDEQNFGADHPNVAIRLNNLAQLLQDTNHLTEAEPLMHRALSIDSQRFGANHPYVAKDLNNLAQLFQDTNRLTEAEPLMRRALDIDEQHFGANHPYVARNLINIAKLLQATNRLAEAEPLMCRALLIDEQYFGADHPEVATDLNILASLLHDTDRLTEAEPLMRRALAIDEQSFGADHPNVARDLNNLARLLQDTNRLAEAEPLMHRALTIDEQRFGADHPKVARDLNNLAQLLQATNRLAEAEPLMRRALAIDEQRFGADHPKVARDLNNLAQLLQATNRLAEAEPLMRRALGSLVASLGVAHPNSQIVGGNYIALLKQMGLGEAEIAERFRSLWLELAGE